MRESDRIAALLPGTLDAILVAGGNRPRQGVLAAVVAKCRQVVAVDGGLGHLRRLGITPQIVIGDLDSARAEDIAWARRQRAHVVFRSQQYDSDLDKALALSKQRKWKSVAVAGVDGDRIDHFIYSLNRMVNIHGLKPVFLFQRSVGCLMSGRCKLELRIGAGRAFSWLGIPLATGASLNGAQWSFNRRALANSGFQSLSNSATAHMVSFSQKSGKSLIIIPIGKI